jgi:hypothetical protein
VEQEVGNGYAAKRRSPTLPHPRTRFNGCFYRFLENGPNQEKAQSRRKPRIARGAASFPVLHSQCNNQAVSDKCTCSASFCRHPLSGCPNPPVVELTVSAMRGPRPEGSPRRSKVCDTCWATLQINLPNVFGVQVGTKIGPN